MVSSILGDIVWEHGLGLLLFTKDLVHEICTLWGGEGVWGGPSA